VALNHTKTASPKSPHWFPMPPRARSDRAKLLRPAAEPSTDRVGRFAAKPQRDVEEVCASGQARCATEYQP
jgi:hypothetical protein